MASIKCGNCTHTHASVADVRACYQYGIITSKPSTLTLVRNNKTMPRVKTPEPGFYIYGSEVVQVTLSKSNRKYAKRLVVNNGKGSWVYAPGLISSMQSYSPITIEEAAAFGARFGVCAICGRTLTNEQSIEQGIGPVCINKIGVSYAS